jgi:hypothetical protein
MSRLVRCDQCGKTTDSDAASNWLDVTRDRQSEDEWAMYDLCTYACLAQWAIAAQDRKVAAK